MAAQAYDAFNPKADVAAPGSYERLFKPAGEGMTFQSPLGTALKGLSDLVGDVTSGVDAIIKSNVTGNVENEVDPQRKQMISDLEATYGTQAVTHLLRPGESTPAMQGAGAPREGTMTNMVSPTQTVLPGPEGTTSSPPPDPSTVQADSLTSGPQQLPKDINDISGKANALYNARNDGHISDTYYWGRLADIASDIRSRYPRGYRNYIDNKIQEVTGRDPANAYIESLIRDINSNVSDKNKNLDKVVAEFYQGNNLGYPGATNMVKGLISGQIPVERGIDMLGRMRNDLDFMDRAQKLFEYQKAQGNNTEQAGVLYMGQTGPRIVQSYFQGIKTINGPGVPDITTPEALNELAAQYKAGKRNIDAKTGLFIATQISAWEKAASDAIDADWQKTGIYSAVTDPAKIKAAKDLYLEPLRQLREAFYKGDVSAVANVTNTQDAANADFGYKMANNKDTAYLTMMMAYLKKTVGDQGAATILEHQPMRNLLNDFDIKTKAIMAQLMTPDDVAKTIGNGQLGGKDYTSLSKSIDSIISGAAQNGLPKDHVQVVQTYQQLFKMIEDGLSDPTIQKEQKQALIKSVFGPENRGVLRKVAPDRPDPSAGPNTIIPGYQTLFYRLTQPDIAKAAHDAGPAYEGLYRDWIKTSVQTDLFRPNLTLLGEQLNNLSTNSAYKVEYDTATHTLNVKVNNEPLAEAARRGLSARGGYGGDLQALLATNSSLNKGLMGMANAARGLGYEGTDVDGFVLDQLVQAGVPGLDKVGGMPPAVSAAIKRAYSEPANKMKQLEERQKEIDQMYTNPGLNSPAPKGNKQGTVKTISYRQPVVNPTDER